MNNEASFYSDPINSFIWCSKIFAWLIPICFSLLELHKDEKAIEYQDKFIFGANHSTNTLGFYQDVVFILSKGEIMIKKITVVITALFALGLTGWASTQPPRDVDTIQSSKSKTLTDPKLPNQAAIVWR